MAQYTASRELVVATCRALLERGYLKATEGNVSVRVPGRALFAVTPSNYDYAKMVTDDICVLDYDQHRVTGTMKASIEAGMHAAVYQHRPDVSVIIHTHQPYASALALMNKPIPALFDEQVRFLGRGVQIVGYAPSGTSFLKNRVKAKLKNGDNAYILANHGVLVLGRDTEHAMHNMALLEKVALDYLLTLLAGEKAAGIPLPIREIAFNKLRGDEKKLAAQEAEAAAEAVAADRAAAAAATAAAAAPSDAAAAAAETAEAKAGGAASLAEPATGASAPPADQKYAISEYPDVAAVYAGLENLVSRPLRMVKAEGHAGVSRLLRDAMRPFQGAVERGQRVHPRRRAAQSGLQLPVPDRHREGRRRLPVGRRRQPLHRLPAGRRPDRAGQQLPAAARQDRRAAQRVRARDRPVPRVRAQAGRAREPVHAGRRDVPHAGLRHRVGHGRHSRGAHIHRQEVRDQGRRRLPRLERPDGLRPARARHVALRGQGHTRWAPPGAPASSIRTI